ncbi:DUF3103 family protein [Chitinimonas lacunae]|uniref:DUF3103 family protein n=1 Tax=Chitinimonas lacunae TaxID=1963018 RepID=A0ABV8MM58_9NEIS
MIKRPLFALTLLALGATQALAATPAVEKTPHIEQLQFVDQAKRKLAVDVAQMLNDPSFSHLLSEKLQGQREVMINPLMSEYRQRDPMNIAKAEAADTLQAMDLATRQHKGITAYSKGLLQVRMVAPQGMSTENVDTSNMLVAFEPAGDDKHWKEVEAYDRFGNVHKLDAKVQPSMPVLVADINGSEDLRAGVAMMNEAFKSRGWGGLNVRPRAGYVETTKLEKIRLATDEEPWISGKAEVYALVSGINPSEEKPTIAVVDMPYLDYANTDYAPNQLVLFWSNYRYAAANLQLFEHDDNTNYQDLVVAIVSGVEKILLAFKPEFAAIATVAGAILQAMPAHWFSNDDDYIDSFYTLEKGKTYTDYKGVGGNAMMTLKPYRLREQ